MRIRRLRSLVLWGAALGAALWLLHRLGDGPLAAPPMADPGRLPDWAADRSPEAVVFAVVRLIALALAWHLTAVTVLGSLARASRLARLVRLADLGTVPAVRRLLSGLVGVGLTATASSVAAAAVIGPPGTPERTQVVMTQLPVDDDGTATLRVLESPDPAPDPAPDPGPAPGAHWTVTPGQCFWTAAEAHLSQAWGRPATEAEVVGYWRRLIDHNRSLLADPGNPDLVLPGQVFELPPP